MNRNIMGPGINNARIIPLLGMAALLLSFALLVPSGAGAIVIKPGKLDHVVIEVPERLVAGETFTVDVRVFDSHNNLITDYSSKGKNIQVSVSGSASASPSVLKAASFSAGSAAFRVSDTKAETIVLTLYDVDVNSPLIRREIRIHPNKLDHFTLDAPEGVTAGEGFEIRVTARDRFENVVTSAKKTAGLTVRSLGATQMEDVALPDFVEGVSTISATARKAGKMAVEVADNSVRGRSREIEVSPAALDHFSLKTPAEAEAGKPFQATITAFDRFGNQVERYGASGRGVEVTSSGGAQAEPSYVAPSDFVKGSATVAVTYTKAEDITLTVAEKDGNQRGKSTRISVRPSAPDHFKVHTPDEATTGETFRLKIEAYDRFENLIKDFDRTGGDVYLRASGSGKLTPEVVAAKEFVDGVATVDAHYDKAESIAISASLSPGGEAVAKPGKKAMQLPPAKKPRAEAQKAPDRKVARAIVPRREEVKREKIFGITGIKLMEAGPRALVIIEIPELSDELRHEDVLESSGGRARIKLRLSPAESELKAEPSFESDLIGQVRVEDTRKDNAADVYIEVLPPRVEYVVKKSESMIIVDVLRLGAAH